MNCAAMIADEAVGNDLVNKAVPFTSGTGLPVAIPLTRNKTDPVGAVPPIGPVTVATSVVVAEGPATTLAELPGAGSKVMEGVAWFIVRVVTGEVEAL